jgi:hypothetical protein
MKEIPFIKLKYYIDVTKKNVFYPCDEIIIKDALPLEQFATDELKTMEKMCWRHNHI